MRKPLLAGVAFFLVLLSGLVWMAVVPLPPCPVTREAFNQINTRMSRAEVEEILGGPPGDYRTRPGTGGDYSPEGGPTGDVPYWWGDEGLVVILFSSTDTVFEKFFHEKRPTKDNPDALYDSTEPGLLETLRWRLNRRWDRPWGR